MQLAWLTDIHLNFCPDRVQELLDRVDVAEPDAVLIGGDIGEAPDVIGRRLLLVVLEINLDDEPAMVRYVMAAG